MLKEKNIWFQYGSLGGRFPASFFTSHWPVAQTKQHLNAREVMDMFRLAPGEYLIVPSTFRPDETASFMLRILSKSETHAQYAHALHSHHHLVFHNAYICKCCKCFYYLFLFLFFFPVTTLGKATVQLKRYVGWDPIMLFMFFFPSIWLILSSLHPSP